MKMEQTRLISLIDSYLQERLTAAESAELNRLLENPEAQAIVEAHIEGQLKTQEYNFQPDLAGFKERLQASIIQQAPVHRVHFLRRFRWAAAAIFILMVSGIVFLLNRKDTPIANLAQAQRDIKAPETNKATITLPNGQRIMLDTVANGTLIAGVARKTADGQLVFEANASGIAYIGTTNPRNSKAMHITLPDNTEVWLNADTYLQYPTNYNVKDRLVTLKGEAYFVVKHNELKPFRVSAGEQTIEDVGTGFNVKAYQDEAHVQTTLLEGVVKINPANGGTVSLKPGQQFSNNKIINANTDEVMAWRNGSFYLDGRELGMIAGELGRWYDVEVVFDNPNTKNSIMFGGEMGRDLTLNQAIRVLEKLNVRCRLEGKKLIVK